MDVRQIIELAEACCARVPERNLSEGTRKSYRKEFVRMWASGSLDPLRPGIALDTYYHRRASLHFGGAATLRALIERIREAEQRQDAATIADLSRKLHSAAQRIEKAFELEPPAPPNVLPWERPPSRWRQSADTDRLRGADSKKYVLKDLPEDWDQRLWLAVGDDWRYREALAVHLTVPVRPEELVAGRRPAGWSAGVVVDLHWPNRLEITFAPVKSHGGLYGTELTTIVIDPTIADEPAKFLAERCRASGDRLVVSIKSKNAVRKAIGALGRKALPGIDIVITPYVMRNQLIADFKATFGGGEIVAAAGGHGTDRTQAGYGHFAHGRARKGYLGISAARPPRAENVERARQLSRGKRLRQKKP